MWRIAHQVRASTAYRVNTQMTTSHRSISTSEPAAAAQLRLPTSATTTGKST